MPKNMIDDITVRVKKAIKTLKKKKTVLFVCTGNTCRSAMAEMIFKSYLKEKELLDFYSVESAGLSVSETDMNMLAKEALSELDIRYTRHTATQLDILAVTNAHSIICMEQVHKDMIVRVVGDQPKIKTMNEITERGDIPDPYGPDFSKYIETAKNLIKACDLILEYLEKEQQPPNQPQPKINEPNPTTNHNPETNPNPTTNTNQKTNRKKAKIPTKKPKNQPKTKNPKPPPE